MGEGLLVTYYRRLVGEKCYLSPVSTDDAAKWAEWFNDLEVTIPLGDEAYTMQSLGFQQAEVAEIIKDRYPAFSIVDLQTDKLIGRCVLFGVSHVNRSANLGIVIGEKEYWSNGYGADAIRLLLDHAFNLMNLNSVMLGTFEFNKRAIKCYQNIGFKEIGRRRQARIIGGRKYDGILMDILAEEFESPFVTRFIEQD